MRAAAPPRSHGLASQHAVALKPQGQTLRQRMLSDPRNAFLIEHEHQQPPPEQRELRALEDELDALDSTIVALNVELDLAEARGASRWRQAARSTSREVTLRVGGGGDDDASKEIVPGGQQAGGAEAGELNQPRMATQREFRCTVLRGEIERVREARRAVVVRLKCAHLQLLDDVEESRLQVTVYRGIPRRYHAAVGYHADTMPSWDTMPIPCRHGIRCRRGIRCHVHLPSGAHLVGWSFGALAALRLAAGGAAGGREYPV